MTARPVESKPASPALALALKALDEAPNPRVVDGAPAYWAWYDGPRQAALEALRQAQA